MKRKVCHKCGASFTVTRRAQARCPKHDRGLAAAAASYRSPAHTHRRREAIAAAGGECEVPGCHSTYRLSLHHLDPKADCGSDELTIVMCANHHGEYEAAERYGRDTWLRRWVRGRRDGLRGGGAS